MRIVAALFSFYLMPSSPVLASTLYIISGFLDAVDGLAARKFKQSNNSLILICHTVVLNQFYFAWKGGLKT